MRMNILTICFITLCGLYACNGKHACYSEDLYNAAQAMDCTMDCPGVCGCDDKFYCNSCIAAQSGIAVDTNNTSCH